MPIGSRNKVAGPYAFLVLPFLKSQSSFLNRIKINAMEEHQPTSKPQGSWRMESRCFLLKKKNSQLQFNSCMIDFNLFLLIFLLKGRKRLKIETPQGTFFYDRDEIRCHFCKSATKTRKCLSAWITAISLPFVPKKSTCVRPLGNYYRRAWLSLCKSHAFPPPDDPKQGLKAN